MDSSLALLVQNRRTSSGKSGSGPHKSRRKKPQKKKERTHTLGTCQSCPFTSQSLSYLRCPVVQQPSHTRVRRAQECPLALLPGMRMYSRTLRPVQHLLEADAQAHLHFNSMREHYQGAALSRHQNTLRWMT